MDKFALRKIAQEKRNRLNEHERSAHNMTLRERLTEHAPFQSANTPLFYVSMGSEVDTHSLIQTRLKEGKRVVVPRVAGTPSSSTLELIEIQSWSDLGLGAFGILEPISGKGRRIDPESLDLILVPGLAFDRNGHRLGYGKGYYDRLLQKTSAWTIGLAYELQIFATIPHEPHDVPLNEILTEKQTVTPYVHSRPTN